MLLSLYGSVSDLKLLISDPDPTFQSITDLDPELTFRSDRIRLTVIARTLVTIRTSVIFGFFYVLYHNSEMRPCFNDIKVAKNSQGQSESEYLFLL